MGPPPHVHENEDGSYHALEGEPEVLAAEVLAGDARHAQDLPGRPCTREMSRELARSVRSDAQRAQRLNDSRVGR